MILTRFAAAWQWFTNPYHFFDKMRQTHGLTFDLHLPLMGKILVTGDPELVREIARHPALEGGKGIAALRRVLGEGSLIMLAGEEHRARHDLIAPYLRGPCLAAYDKPTVEFARAELTQLPVDVPFSAYALAQRISLRVIVQVIFGTLDAADDATARRLIEEFLHSFSSAWVLYLKPLQVDWGPWSPWGKMLRRRTRLLALIQQRIDLLRANAAPSNSVHPAAAPQDGGLLAYLLADGTLSDAEIATEVLALLLFGHDTGAATMAWALAHILQDATVTAALHAELARADDGGLPQLDALPLLDAAIDESMRLAPVVVQLARVAQCPITLGHADQTQPEAANTMVAAGAVVMPCVYLAQHNPTVFAEPDEFRPARFHEGASYPYAYFPYGFGARTCIGKSLVARQMRLILAVLLRTGELGLAPGYRPTPERRLVLILPKAGCRLIRREHMA